MERYRIHHDVPIYYLTFTVVHWLPVFISQEACQIITDSLNFCHEQKGLRVNAFVIMPTHMHLIVFDVEFDSSRLQKTLTDMRKFTGQRLADYSEKRLPGAFGQLLRPVQRTDRTRQFWQPTKHSEAIRSRAFWETKVSYLHDNPRRKGLVWSGTDWRFSSAAYWLLDPPGDSDVLLSAVEWL